MIIILNSSISSILTPIFNFIFNHLEHSLGSILSSHNSLLGRVNNEYFKTAWCKVREEHNDLGAKLWSILKSYLLNLKNIPSKCLIDEKFAPELWKSNPNANTNFNQRNARKDPAKHVENHLSLVENDDYNPLHEKFGELEVTLLFIPIHLSIFHWPRWTTHCNRTLITHVWNEVPIRLFSSCIT